MRSSLRIAVSRFDALAVLAALGLGVLAVSCRTPSVQIEQPGDASRYRTWNFLQPPRAGAGHESDVAEELESNLAEQLEIGLSGRGFRRAALHPELLVYLQLGVREQWVEQHVTGAIEHVSSLHDAPSYDVQTTRTERKRYEIADLLVMLIDSRSRRVVWRGRIDGRYPDAFAPHLGETVFALLSELPRARPSTTGRTRIASEDALPAPTP